MNTPNLQRLQHEGEQVMQFTERSATLQRMIYWREIAKAEEERADELAFQLTDALQENEKLRESRARLESMIPKLRGETRKRFRA